jgi:hypothetical protein
MIKLRRLKLTGYVARMRGMRNAYRILVGKLEGKRPLGEGCCRWEDDTRMYLRNIMRVGVDWNHLIYVRVW